MNPTGKLGGAGVWVTRPLHQARALAERIAAEGGRAVCLPAMDIVDVEDPKSVSDIVGRLELFHLAIFVSANAVNRGLRYVATRGEDGPMARVGLSPGMAGAFWPASVPVAAIGKATAKALRAAGVPPDFQSAPPYNSESLVADRRLRTEAIAGARVVIFRGVGGRALLGETLAGRSARVTYAEVYRRVLPGWRKTAPFPLDRIQVIVATSGEGLENLFAMAADAERERLRETPFVVIGERMAAAARDLGIRHPPIVAGTASDDGIMAALCAWPGPGR